MIGEGGKVSSLKTELSDGSSLDLSAPDSPLVL